MASGSVGFGEVRLDMLEKHDSGYRVTLHTALSESAELDESDGDSSGDSVSSSWISAPSMRPMVRVKRRMAKIATVVMRGFRVMAVFVFRGWD